MNDLKKWLAAVLKLPESTINETTSMANTSAWDSMSHMEIVLSVEERYQINLDGDEIANMRSLSEIVTLLKSKGIEVK